MKIEPGESQAKPEQSVGSEAALGRQSSGRAGESLPTAPSTPARALLLRLLLRSTSLPSHQINHELSNREKGGSDGSQPGDSPLLARAGGRGARGERALPWAGAGRHWASFGGAARDGGWPSPASLLQPPPLVPLRCHSHGHRWMQDSTALDQE